MSGVCSICRKVFLMGHGHNAQPYNDGRCCDGCNFRIVIPLRIAQEMGWFIEEENDGTLIIGDWEEGWVQPLIIGEEE